MVLDELEKQIDRLLRSLSGEQSEDRARQGREGTAPGEEQAGERMAVWQTIARLWLAQELREYELHAIAWSLSRSRYHWPELQRIYLYEVAPAVHENLRRTGGVWGAFDPGWLKAAILKNMSNPDYRQEALRNREYLTEFVARDWERVKQYFHELRFGRRLTAEELRGIARLLQEADE